MTKEELIANIKAGKASAIYKHIGECTDYFDYDKMDNIIIELDNKEQMDLFAKLAAAEYNFYLYCSGELYDNICSYDSNYHQPKYGQNIASSLARLIENALERKRIDAEFCLPKLIEFDSTKSLPISSPQEWIETSERVTNAMSSLDSQIQNWLLQLQTVSSQGISQLEALKNFSLLTLRQQYDELFIKYKVLETRNAQLEKWHTDWQALKAKAITGCFPKVPMNDEKLADPTTMLNVLVDIENHHHIEEQLKAENAALKQQQDRWRDSPEYKAEIAKLKKENSDAVPADKIRAGIMEMAKHSSDPGSLDNFVLKINHALRHTAWGQGTQKHAEISY